MNKRYLTADLVLTPDGLKSGLVISIDDAGTILGLHDQNELLNEWVDVHEGVLCPGFVNAHCHLELSHLKGRIAKGSGMAEFARQIVGLRAEKIPAGVFEAAIEQMKANGIVAVGDIANKTDAFEAKSNNSLYFHTFIELFGTDPALAETKFQEGQKLIELLPAQVFLAASIAPHAPYSLSTKLLKRIFEFGAETNGLFSLHLLESEEERQFFEQHEGAFVELFEKWGIDFRPNKADAIEYSLQFLREDQRILLVHCTQLTAEEMHELQTKAPNAYFCLCPRANQYITGQLPNFDLFSFKGKRVCIGTDSLASNDSLDILEELKLIQTEAPNATAEQLLFCATRNGANFLGIQSVYGALETGKRPGINLIRGILNDKITNEATVTRLV